MAKNEISSENDQSLSVTVVDALVHVLNLNTAKTSQSAQDIIALINYALKVGERIVGSREKAAQLPFISIVTKRVTDNCYQRAWYAKSGACVILNYVIETFPLKWLHHLDYSIFSSLMFTIRDLCDEVSFGAVDEWATFIEMGISNGQHVICPKQGKMYHNSIPAQIGILDGTRYCLDLKPNPLLVFPIPCIK